LRRGERGEGAGEVQARRLVAQSFVGDVTKYRLD